MRFNFPCSSTVVPLHLKIALSAPVSLKDTSWPALWCSSALCARNVTLLINHAINQI